MLVYFVANSFVDFTSPILKYVAFAVLVVLAVKLMLKKPDDRHGHFHDNAMDMEHEHEHKHPETGLHTHRHCHTKRAVLSQRKIASCPFCAGFRSRRRIRASSVGGGRGQPAISDGCVRIIGDGEFGGNYRSWD